MKRRDVDNKKGAPQRRKCNLDLEEWTDNRGTTPCESETGTQLLGCLEPCVCEWWGEVVGDVLEMVGRLARHLVNLSEAYVDILLKSSMPQWNEQLSGRF